MAKKDIQEAQLKSLKSMLREILSDWTLPQDFIEKTMKVGVKAYLSEISKGKNFDHAVKSSKQCLSRIIDAQSLTPSNRKKIKDSMAYANEDDDFTDEEKALFKGLLKFYEEAISSGDSEEVAFKKTEKKANDLCEQIVEARPYREGIINVLPMYLSCQMGTEEYGKRYKNVLTYFANQIANYTPPHIAAPKTLKFAREELS